MLFESQEAMFIVRTFKWNKKISSDSKCAAELPLTLPNHQIKFFTMKKSSSIQNRFSVRL